MQVSTTEFRILCLGNFKQKLFDFGIAFFHLTVSWRIESVKMIQESQKVTSVAFLNTPRNVNRFQNEGKRADLPQREY